MIPAGNTVPYKSTPRATIALVVICVVAYLYQMTLGDAALKRFLLEHALVPARYTTSGIADVAGLSRWNLTPFLTNMFLHGGLLHLVGNMWTLWVFGPALEDRLGSGRFLTLYLLAGLAAGGLHMLFNLFSPIPALGASGAIAGIIAAYARRFPWAWVNVLQPIVIFPVFFMLPALAFAGLWFLTQVLAGTMSLFGPSGGGIAWWAHIGGFVAGWWLVRRTGAPEDPVGDARAQSESALWPWTFWWRMQSRWWHWWMRR
ncbi:MAG TPA: rhomboid family intramembrane serine protease [Hyphomicrobiaceae bacterium]|nr:rhomboid family intramembrane serine protease [Hyphomicrobiaceae bacterium]